MPNDDMPTIGDEGRAVSTVIRWVAWGFIILVVIGALTLGYRQIFGVREANVERDIFEHSNSFVDGAITAIEEQCTIRQQAITAGDTDAQYLAEDVIKRRASKVDIQDIRDRLGAGSSVVKCIEASRN